MNPKSFFRSIRDHRLDLQERMFRLLVTIGLSGLGIGVLVGFLIGENQANNLTLVAAFFVFFAITALSIHFHQIQKGAVLIAVLLIVLVLPFNFLTTGDIYGGGPLWFLFGVVFVCLVVEKGIKYFLLGGCVATQAACYFIAYTHPEYVEAHSLRVAYIDSFVSLTIVSLLICGMILFQKHIYREENALAQQQKREIEELNRMQNQFFSNMSHEIRTPINTIIGLNEMILREAVSSEVAEDAKSIQGASKMLLTLINDILDMSKIESGKMDIVPVAYDTGDMLSDVVNMIWIRTKEKGLQFHIDVDQTMPSRLYGDEVRIKQVLINVLNNAVKYTTEGEVTLSIQCKRRENDNVYITYTVTDTGIGIKKENISHLFGAFKRVDEERNRHIEGTGLGLAIVKQLVDLMGGEILVNSVYTKGSSFVITIPQKVADEAAIGKLDFETRHTMNGREHYRHSFEAPRARVLVVDDNATNLMVAEKLLRDTKVQVETVVSGAECLQHTLETRYDVILMDHLMPQMDGIECLHEIRRQVGGLNLTTPVVVLTANAGGEDRALYRREGFDGYLLKPVSGAQMEAELIRHIPQSLVTAMRPTGTKDDGENLVLEHRNRKMILITTESVCDLPKEYLEKYQIAVIPYRVITEGGEFLDGIETETDGVLSYMQTFGKKVKSQDPSIEDFEAFFAEQLTKAQYVIHISLAKNVGKGYYNASEAARAFNNVTVINSGHLSSGMGLMVMRAADCVAEGMDVESIVKEVTQMQSRVRTSFIVNTTEYLTRAGRLSSKVDTICRAFLIHPVIGLKNSSMKTASVRIGTKGYAWKQYILSCVQKMRRADKRVLFITHAGLTKGELDDIEEEIKKHCTFERVIRQKASPAISANCGPGTFGLLYLIKQ